MADRAESDAEFNQSLTELLSGGHAVRTLALAESLAKKSGRTLAELLGDLEMALNATYRQNMKVGGPIAMRKRRTLLADMKRLVLTGMVPVNAQMGLEAIGLSVSGR